MDAMTNEALKSIICSRIDAALQNLDNSYAYQEICRQQDKTEAAVEKLYEIFDEQQLLIIHNHYEGQECKNTFKVDAAYMQGVHDCFHLMDYLGRYDLYL